MNSKLAGNTEDLAEYLPGTGVSAIVYLSLEDLPLSACSCYLSTKCVQAHNGSGKTTCFALAMLSRVDPAQQYPQAICVCPTRELVVQNLAVVQRMGKFASITSTSTARTDFQLSRHALLAAEAQSEVQLLQAACSLVRCDYLSPPQSAQHYQLDGWPGPVVPAVMSTQDLSYPCFIR